jgi:hypothetical protein
LQHNDPHKKLKLKTKLVIIQNIDSIITHNSISKNIALDFCGFEVFATIAKFSAWNPESFHPCVLVVIKQKWLGCDGRNCEIVKLTQKWIPNLRTEPQSGLFVFFKPSPPPPPPHPFVV